MKMEVVLSSPGRFGDDGTPFKSEEVREWSRVDRLTGMLERARIETGRWRSNNDAAAHSYGKVTDERERNSADGSIIQKAKRQVEIFQSQEPGRSVQVVRASQWSSSRVTDCVMDSILPFKSSDSVLNGINDALSSDKWKFPALKSLSSLSKIHSDHIQSDNNKSNFPSIDHRSSSSSSSDPINKKHINLNNSLEKYGLSKKSSSDDDLSSLLGSTDSSSKNSSMSFSRDCKNRRSLQIPHSVSIAVSSGDAGDGKKTFDHFANNGIYSTISSATSGPSSASVKFGNEVKSSRPNDYGSLRFKSSPLPLRSTASNRANAVTVVNIMNPESFADNSRSRKSSIVTLRSSPIAEENNLTTGPYQQDVNSLKTPLTKTNSSGDEGTVVPSRAVKKVGFCKTEVHFAADSGKVNIVETDGKPPPTNKFRRRRRNQNPSGTGNFHRSLDSGVNGNIGGVNGKMYPRRMIIKTDIPEKIKTSIENDCSGAYCVVDLDTKKYWTADERDGNKIHATMVNVAQPIDQRIDREHEELKKPKELSSPKVVSEVISRRSNNNNQDQTDFSIVTKDAENNKVLSTIVTTHEPIIARVEDNLPSFKKSLEKSITSSLRKKCGLKRVSSLQKNDADGKNLPSKISNVDNYTSNNKDPVYVNVFKVTNSRSPVYENYCAPTSDNKSTSEDTSELSETFNATSLISETSGLKDSLEKKTSSIKKAVTKKDSSKSGKRSPANASRSATWSSGSIGRNTRDSLKSTKALKTIGLSGCRSTTINGDVKVQQKSSPLSELTAKRSEDIKTGSTRSKKPLEVVYRTAVFNMKNEKLSPTIKRKDTNKVGPRYINDLICGSKSNRTSNSKHKGVTVSQNINKQTQKTTTSHWK